MVEKAICLVPLVHSEGDEDDGSDDGLRKEKCEKCPLKQNRLRVTDRSNRVSTCPWIRTLVTRFQQKQSEVNYSGLHLRMSIPLRVG